MQVRSEKGEVENDHQLMLGTVITGRRCEDGEEEEEEAEDGKDEEEGAEYMGSKPLCC